ncbi:MAG TPA: FG-GAP-like repeat-containing protein [Vicinamibacteria bacterium]|nr:FG-GAP-like repeat-containing protein [Vicinamibacteria bacterium]
MTAAALVVFALLQTGESLQRDRNLGKAYYERGEYALAVEAFERVIALEAASGRDYFNAGMAYLQNQDDDRALAALSTARQIEPALVEVDFGLGVLHKRAQRYPLARDAFQRVLARDPDDPCTWFNLGAVSFSIGHIDEAAEAFRRVLAIGHPRGQNFYVSALFRYAGMLARAGNQDEARQYLAEFESLRQEMPSVSLTPAALENGRYGRVELPPSPSPAEELAPGQSRLGRGGELPVPECDTVSPPALGDFDGDGLTDAFLASPCGADRLYRTTGRGRLEDVTGSAGLGASRQSLGALFIDYLNSGLPALYVWGSDEHHLYRNEDGRFEDVTRTAGFSAVAPPSTAVTLDFDNDGQLDVLVGGPQDRLSALRNDGDGSFTETSVSDASPSGTIARVAAADFDQDGFTDVLVARGEAAPPLLLVNDGGSFRATTLPVSGPYGQTIDLVDFDRDSWIDVALSGDPSSEARFLRNRWGVLGSLTRAPAISGPLVPLDGDADGAVDFLFSGGRLLSYRFGGGFEERAISMAGRLAASPVAADLEGEGNLTVLIPGTSGKTIALVRVKPENTNFVRITLLGKRTNRLATGSLIELKAGRFYLKLIYPGHPVTLFTGNRERLDVIRVSWTNGVIQNVIDVETGQALRIEEEERQSSSCPFLYVWDGERFRFLTDVVGRAPLGEVLPDGSLLTPYPEDYVRVPPGTMAERNGELVFQVTEELRELAYLDAVELVAVDRPRGVEIFANERFSSPPFEPFRLYAIGERHAPSAATNGLGDDVISHVGRRDGTYAPGVVPYRVPGFARDQVLELRAPSTVDGDRLWLFLSGWVYWPSSSSMKALSASETFTPEPPRLEVPDRSGGWRTAIDDLGLPSGSGRTIVADLSNRLVEEDRRVRIVTNFEVYWDEAFFAQPASEQERASHSIAPFSAELHFRGFSRVSRRSRSEPERYDYENLLTEAPWNATEGSYTRYGERVDLILEADGRLVVMAPGDELTLRFDRAALPPTPVGSERDFLLHFTGWAKDQDPNTRHSRTVEPLPVTASRDGSSWGRSVPALVPPLVPPGALPGNPGPGIDDKEREQ